MKALTIMRTLACAIFTATIAAGCAVKPVAISDQAHLKRVAEDQRRLFDEQEPVVAPLSLSAAFARAMKYNLEYRTRLMEEAASLGQADLANFDLLPRLTAAAGYSTRNNDAFGFGYTPAGTISATPSAASERRHTTESLSFSWNVLDFGVSYLRAKQLADQSLIAEERRRKALQNLLQDVRNAWWRVEAAQRLLPEADALLTEIHQASARAKLIETRKLLPPLQIVAYKRSLLDLEQQISAKRQELEQAKLELAQLLNLRPGLEYSVETARIDDPVPPDLTTKIDVLEQMAVRNRPELREEGYRSRITDLEADKQLLSLFPALSADVTANSDSNKYLVNQRWSSLGLNLSWNMMKLISLPSLNSASQSAAKVDETRRLALTAAVLAQTRIAAVRYRLMVQEFVVWDDAVNDDMRIVGYLNASKQVGLETELELIRAKGRGMISKINRDLMFSNVQGSIGRLYNSIGLDSLSLDMESKESNDLAAALSNTLQEWEANNFSPKPVTKQIPVLIAPIQGLPKEDAEVFMTSMQRIMRLSKVALAASDQNPQYRIESSVKLTEPGVSGQPVVVKLKLVDQTGRVLFEGTQNSMLMTPVGAEQWRALGEGAGYRAIDPVRQNLVRTELAADSRARVPSLPTVAPDRVPSAKNLEIYADEIRRQTSKVVAESVSRGESE